MSKADKLSYFCVCINWSILTHSGLASSCSIHDHHYNARNHGCRLFSCSRPSATNHNFGSRKENGPEQVTISPGMPFYNNSCVLRVAVHHPFIDYAGYDVT